MALFEAQHVTKQFANHLALDKVSISVPQQSIFGLLGPNGAGKTTLIRIINQITAPDEGTILFNGRKLKSDDVANIGYLPEERGLYKKMKVGEQALYFGRLKGLSRAEAMTRLKYWFKKLDIIDWWDKKVEELSKGMQQKAQFVITVLHKPDLLIFDEPFSGFDPVNAEIIKKEILGLRDQGATVIFSTHNMSSVEELCDDITLIDNARTLLEGRVEDIRNKWAANEYYITFTGTATLNGSQNFDVIDSKSDNGRTVVRIVAGDNTNTNMIIGEALKAGSVTGFNPALPSMNEIFIRVVESRKKEKKA